MGGEYVAAPCESLEALLSPIEPARFLQEYYFRAPVHIPGDVLRFSRLLSWEGLNRAMTRQRPRRPPLRLAKDGKLIPQEQFATRETNAAGDLWRADFRVVRRLLEAGATIVVDRIDETHEPLGDFCRMLEWELGSYVFADAFASWHNTRGFPTHWDPEQVFVVQLIGTKRWRLLKPERLHPTQQDKARHDRPPTQVYWEGELKAGDVLYIPGGWWHDALAVDGRSLHVAFSLFAATGLTAMNALLRELQEDELARAPLPRFASEAEQQDYMRRLLDAVEARMRGCTVKSVLEKIDVRAAARNRLSMPWSWGSETEAIPGHAWVHWLPPRPVALSEAGAEFSFQAIGGRFAFEIDYLPVFRDLIGHRKSSVSDLCSRYGHLPVEKILLQLVHLGLVAIADDAVI